MIAYLLQGKPLESPSVSGCLTGDHLIPGVLFPADVRGAAPMRCYSSIFFTLGVSAVLPFHL